MCCTRHCITSTEKRGDYRLTQDSPLRKNIRKTFYNKEVDKKKKNKKIYSRSQKKADDFKQNEKQRSKE